MKGFSASRTFLIIAGFTVFLLHTFVMPTQIYATPLLWQKSNGFNALSQEVRVSPSNSNIIYATYRDSVGFSGLYKSSNGGLTFLNKFPLMTTRDVNSIAISFSNEDKLWIGTYEQGVFKSDDGGENWISSGLSNVRVRFITIDPTNEEVLYAGTGESNSDGGIYKSIDGGLNWNKVGAASYGSQNCLGITVDPHNSSKVFAGSGTTTTPLFRSSDSGVTWMPLSGINSWAPSTVVDKDSSLIVYASDDNNGVYKSTDGGNSWSLKNNGIGGGLIFRLSQDTLGNLYGSRRNSGGGVWQSTNGAENWVNVGDQSWGGNGTWGLDTGGGRIFASVEGLGLFFANTDGTPVTPPQEVVCDSLSVTPSSGNSPLTVNAALSGHTINGGSVENYIFDFGDGSKFFPIPTNSRLHIYNTAGTFTVNGHVVDNLGHVSPASDSCRTTVTVTNPLPPVTVVVPGLGASWNAGAILNCDITAGGDWTLASYAEPVYQPIMDALASAGVENRLFAYDWRNRVSETSHILNDFLDTLPGGQSANLVGHSLGGLVGRAYLEQHRQDHRLSKYLSVGSPHQGATDAYYPWEGGDIKLNNFVQKLAVQLLLRHCGGLAQTDRSVIQVMVPSIRNLLPTYSYLKDWKTGEINSNLIWANDWLQTPFSVPDNVIFGTLSGTGFETSKIIKVKGRSFLDTALGNWDDGKPAGKETTFEGDGTVTTESSQLLGPTNIVIGQDHSGLIAANEGINQIFNFLGIPTTLPLSAFNEPRSALIIIGYPASFSVEDKGGKITNDKNNLVSVLNPTANRYKFTLIPSSDNTLFIIGQFLENDKVLWKEYHLLGKERKQGIIQFDPESPSEDPLKL